MNGHPLPEPPGFKRGMYSHVNPFVFCVCYGPRDSLPPFSRFGSQAPGVRKLTWQSLCAWQRPSGSSRTQQQPQPPREKRMSRVCVIGLWLRHSSVDVLPCWRPPRTHRCPSCLAAIRRSDKDAGASSATPSGGEPPAKKTKRDVCARLLRIWAADGRQRCVAVRDCS